MRHRALVQYLKSGPFQSSVFESWESEFLQLISFLGHWVGSWRDDSEKQLAQGHPAPSLLDHLGSAQFWFESMQNWQSEFLAVLAVVVLSIYLREKDSPQSKPVEAPHSETGG